MHKQRHTLADLGLCSIFLIWIESFSSPKATNELHRLFYQLLASKEECASRKAKAGAVSSSCTESAIFIQEPDLRQIVAAKLSLRSLAWPRSGCWILSEGVCWRIIQAWKLLFNLSSKFHPPGFHNHIGNPDFCKYYLTVVWGTPNAPPPQHPDCLPISPLLLCVVVIKYLLHLTVCRYRLIAVASFVEWCGLRNVLFTVF